MKKLWKYRHFRLAAAGIILTLLGLSFSLSGSGTAETGGLTETVRETGEARETAETASGTERQPEDTGSAAPPGSAPSGAAVSGTDRNLLHVFVCGSVRRPDVYVLPEGSRITDAVRAAGGFSDDAARDALNLAELISDGEKIRIPSKEERQAALSPGGAESASGGAENVSGIAENAAGTTAASAGGRIDLNSASLKELTALPGIGESKAARIIAWREQHGPFRNTRELMEIPGIKQATYNELKDHITAE